MQLLEGSLGSTDKVTAPLTTLSVFIGRVSLAVLLAVKVEEDAVTDEAPVAVVDSGTTEVRTKVLQPLVQVFYVDPVENLTVGRAAATAEVCRVAFLGCRRVPPIEAVPTTDEVCLTDLSRCLSIMFSVVSRADPAGLWICSRRPALTIAVSSTFPTEDRKLCTRDSSLIQGPRDAPVILAPTFVPIYVSASRSPRCVASSGRAPNATLVTSEAVSKSNFVNLPSHYPEVTTGSCFPGCFLAELSMPS